MCTVCTGFNYFKFFIYYCIILCINFNNNAACCFFLRSSFYFFVSYFIILNLRCSLFVSINNSQRQRPHNQPQIMNLSERMSLECIAKLYVPTKRGMILGRTKNTLHERLIAKLGVQSSIGLLFKSI